MKEILYIQAGSVSNHIGTHFWNTQESYFTYSSAEPSSAQGAESADSDLLVDHDVSFRAGRSAQAKDTFCPRVLIFDHRSNFGTLPRYNELYQDPDNLNGSAHDKLWNGAVNEFRQDPITKSAYQLQLEEGESTIIENSLKRRTARFWSDYNRVFYAPRSIQQVPDLPDWDAGHSDWSFGQSIFKAYDADHSVLDEDLRLFVEECDNFQGFQVLFDNSTFGGFTQALMTAIRDDFAKSPILTFPIISGLNPSIAEDDNSVSVVEHARTVMRDTLCLQSLDELATASVPLPTPTRWITGPWSNKLDLEMQNLYQTSAVLSAHIETATLPLRSVDRRVDLFDLCSQLNWPQNTRFSHLSGEFPADDHLREQAHDFSVLESLLGVRPLWRPLAQRNVTRGLSVKEVINAEGFFAGSDLHEPYISNVHAPAYPLPTSFPAILREPVQPAKIPARQGINIPQALLTTKMVSSLTTTTATASLFRALARFTDEIVRTRGVGLGAEADIDEMREIAGVMWNLQDSYSGGEYGEDGASGEDE
ncbi:tubulin nucleotide-binding domain-like protein [Rickenella mellea]|uniref:Tubulin nucleotide-binding domain-like protein n=1 Tax=Rickenella mellea TaxID=50990 RepID=A0A4Y7QHU5_9AGAM|nr:tubulin nucleotide-binding domain-like protein [Rickenella mellea]